MLEYQHFVTIPAHPHELMDFAVLLHFELIKFLLLLKHASEQRS